VIRDWLIATLLGYLERGEPKPRTAPHIPPAQRRPMKISAEAVGMSRIGSSRGVTTTIGASDAFRAARPAPGMVPDGVKPMAMDEDFGWLAGQSQYTENLGWLGMPFLAELAQRAEYRQIVETLAKDMTRRWIKVTATGDDDKTERVNAIEDALKKYKIRQKFRRLAELDGFFGRGHLYVDTGCTSDRDLLKVPLILDRRTFRAQGALPVGWSDRVATIIAAGKLPWSKRRTCPHQQIGRDLLSLPHLLEKERGPASRH
jgi:hypothetical protein